MMHISACCHFNYIKIYNFIYCSSYVHLDYTPGKSFDIISPVVCGCCFLCEFLILYIYIYIILVTSSLYVFAIKFTVIIICFHIVVHLH